MTTAEVRLWPEQADAAIAETTDARGFVHRVAIPRITPYLARRCGGTGIIVCPGGGYAFLDVDPHVVRLARVLDRHGISVFGLHYRTSPPSTTVPGDALADLRRAIGIVREQAVEHRIDPDRLVGLGFSAGAHLLLSHACRTLPSTEREGLRGMVLMCPWPMGRSADDFRVRPDAPPALLCATAEDTVAPLHFARGIAVAMRAAGRDAELVSHPHGGHLAYNLYEDGAAVDWIPDLLAWLSRQGLRAPA